MVLDEESIGKVQVNRPVKQKKQEHGKKEQSKVVQQKRKWMGKRNFRVNPIWTDLLQITVLCGVCRVEETTATLAY